MYVAKILVPEILTKGINGVKLKPDRVLIESIFTFLHLNQHQVGREYKYILDFPKFKETNIGNQINIFAKNKEDLISHIKTQKLYRLITDNCKLKIEEVISPDTTDFHKLKISKESKGLGLSKIKRLIRREQGEVYKMHLKGLSLKEISDILLKDDNKKEIKQFVKIGRIW